MPRVSTPLKLALLSLPWSLFNRPSIQLGALKSFLDQHSDFQTDLFHPYLHLAKKLGTELYYQISVDGWAGDAVYAALLFPEKRNDSRKLFMDSIDTSVKKQSDFDTLLKVAEKSASDYLKQINLASYRLVGFSVCFSQLMSSLYVAKKIKEMSPDTSVVFGGSICAGEVGKSILHQFPYIDYLIDGEGEGALLHLCEFLAGKSQGLPKYINAQHQHPRIEQSYKLQKLDKLPVPDYSSYFAEMKQTFPSQPFIPILPIEFSRGCWWNKCSFCNLNLQWQNYRYKDSRKMLEEVNSLTQKHESLNFAFTDNALPPVEADTFFNQIAKEGLDFNFFAEIRSITSQERLQEYSRGCLRTAQVGIEALSSSLLSKMAKGTSVMDNIVVMKMCHEHNIKLEGNLIINFPTSTQAEIDETLNNLDFVLPFAPLQTARFFLGYGSPMYEKPREHGISALLPHNKNRLLFPKKYLDTITPLISGYRGDKHLQTKLWKPVIEKVENWQKFHENRSGKKILSYRDGGTFLIIRQERPDGPPLLHRLRGISRKIYTLCCEPQSIENLLIHFPKVKEQALRAFIDEMAIKRLMFTENDQVLSLAVRTQE